MSTRIQRQNRERILEAALDVFSANGFRGSTLDQIASVSGLSKPNLLYYFDSKEAMHRVLMEQLLDVWLAPLRAMAPDGNPHDEIMGYMRRKLQMSRDYPRESRLFANEVLQGAPRLTDAITGELKTLVEERVAIIQAWVDAGQLAAVDPYHLIFSIWALTQHYADFDAQIRLIRGKTDPMDGAEAFLDMLFDRLLAP
jgi:TetR/AcrR family transcriptional regulator